MGVEAHHGHKLEWKPTGLHWGVLGLPGLPHPRRIHSPGPSPSPSPGPAGLRKSLHSTHLPRPRTHMVGPNFPSSRGASATEPIGQTTCRSQDPATSLARLRKEPHPVWQPRSTRRFLYFETRAEVGRNEALKCVTYFKIRTPFLQATPVNRFSLHAQAEIDFPDPFLLEDMGIWW